MRVIAYRTLKQFWESSAAYKDVEEPARVWFQLVEAADWKSPADVKAELGTASILKDGRVVFNLAGNKYRLVVWINYPYRVVYVRFIGTHKQYDAIDAQTIYGSSMNIKPIRTKRDYEAVLKTVEGLMHAKAGSPEGDRLDILVTLIQAYEAKHYPMLPPDPVEAIKFVMEQRGLTVQDLLPVFGRANRAYEVLNRTRPLSLAMIRKLHSGFGIPADVLIAA